MNAEMVKIIVEAVFGLVTILITSYLIPWIKGKIGEDKYTKLVDYTELAVRAAEQVYTPEQWESKKKYVLDCVTLKAEQIGIDMTQIDIENLIEGLVNAVKKG